MMADSSSVMIKGIIPDGEGGGVRGFSAITAPAAIQSDR
jgi:hypothetical protein